MIDRFAENGQKLLAEYVNDIRHMWPDEANQGDS